MNSGLLADDTHTGAKPKRLVARAIPRGGAALHPLAVLGLQALAFWPVLQWYGLRIAEPGEEGWGLVGLLAAGWVVCKGVIIEGRRAGGSGIGWAPVIATCVYAGAFPFLSPLPRALLAMLALACLLPFLGLRRSASLHTAGFLFLSLPIMPSLQFYLGYPLRMVSGEAAARLINLAGFPVVREGALLNWRDHAVFIDAPCSGVKMLWAGLMLAWALSALRGHGPWRTAGLAVIAVGAVVAGNIMRTTSLFFLETGVVHGPHGAHTAVGVVSFIAVAGLIAWAGGMGSEGAGAERAKEEHEATGGCHSKISDTKITDKPFQAGATCAV